MKTIDQKKLSDEIRSKYSIVNNSLRQVAKNNPKDLVVVEIGDTKQSDFFPQVKVCRWGTNEENNEVNASIRLLDFDNFTIENDKEKIKLVNDTKEVEMYALPSSEEMEDGGFEFNTILKVKPTTNVLTFSLNTKELDFFYQPALTQEEIDEGASRPENVVGSYAVYHKTKGRMNDIAGMEYKAGKAFHIYRPRVTDANGDEIWGELNVDTESGLLTITVDQAWLNRAVYPVWVDPTFGYTSIGGTSAGGGDSDDYLRGSYFTTSEGGGVLNIMAYQNIATVTWSAKAGIYLESDLSLVAQSQNEPVISSGKWWNYTFSPTSVSASTNYYLLSFLDNSNASSAIVLNYYDSHADNIGLQEAVGTTAYSTFPDPIVTPTNQARQYSIYAIYRQNSVASIVKQVSLFNEPTATRANTAYAVPSFSMPWLYTAGNYDGTIEVYFEAVMSITATYTARAGLYTTGGTQIVTSLVTTTSTSPARVRSGNIAPDLADGTAYQVRISSSNASGTNTLYACRLVIIQSGTITKTETIYDFGSTDTETSGAYADDGQKAGYYYDADQFDGTVAIYFEAFISNSTGTNTTYAQLHDGSSAVTGSEVSVTSATDTRVRSSAISLTDNTTYKVQIKNSATTARCRAARMVIVQSGTPTKTESYYPIKMTANTATNSAENSNGLIYWDNDEWGTTTKTVLHEAWASVNSGDTAYTDLNDGTNDDDTRSITSTTIARDISGSLTLDDNTNYDAQVRNSDASTSIFYGSFLRIQATFSSGGVASVARNLFLTMNKFMGW